jgi:hypothetical protein
LFGCRSADPLFSSLYHDKPKLLIFFFTDRIVAMTAEKGPLSTLLAISLLTLFDCVAVFCFAAC